jgi:hypothetical protein
MPRADLHSALVLDRDIFEASQVEPDLLDPVVRTWGGIPGPARPVTVLRAYQGPQGFYAEHFVITDRDGTEVARSPKQRVHLSGEAFEDEFRTVLEAVHLRSGAEHTASFFIDDEVVGEIPVFIEPAMGGDASVAAEEAFKKAVQKGSVVWLTVPQPPQGRGRKREARDHTQPVWFVAEGSTLYVFTGPTEQQVPNLATVPEVGISARSKDIRSKISEVRATVRVIPTDDPLWDKIATSGLGRRLNLPDGDGAKDRWREQCTLVELTPRFRHAEEAGGSAAAGETGARTGGAPADAPAGDAPAAAAPKKKVEEDIHVDVEIDQEVFDQLIAEGTSERVARAKAKAAYVRKEKARIRAERGEGEDAA